MYKKILVILAIIYPTYSKAKYRQITQPTDTDFQDQIDREQFELLWRQFLTENNI